MTTGYCYLHLQVDLSSLCSAAHHDKTLTFPDVQFTLLITLVGGMLGSLVFSGESMSVLVVKLVRYIYRLRDLDRRRDRRTRKIGPLTYGV